MSQRSVAGYPALFRILVVLGCIWVTGDRLLAIDWPYHLGKTGLGVWEETGILEKFPPEGLASRVRWRTPVNMGYAGAAIADGRVFITDFVWTTRPLGTERVLALDEQTGKILWTHQWAANYKGIGWDRGPKTTPTVDDDRVYVSGAAGALFCFDVKTGAVQWKKEFLVDYPGPRQKWHSDYGFVAPVLIDGDNAIVKVGGEPNAKIVAFNKRTGKEIWRALSSAEAGPAYSPMVIINSGHRRQLIVWHDSAVDSLDPSTGEVYWEHPWSRTSSLAVPPPLQAGSLLFFTGYYGARALALSEEKPAPPEEIWRSASDSETVTDTVNSLMMTPLIIGDYVYAVDSHGELRCLDLKTGERMWETLAVTRDRALHATAHLIRNGDRVFIVNDFGELIIAKLDPMGYHEISRTQLIAPTAPASQRRTRPNILWTPPAFANKHIIIRNDEEIISVNLAAS